MWRRADEKAPPFTLPALAFRQGASLVGGQPGRRKQCEPLLKNIGMGEIAEASPRGDAGAAGVSAKKNKERGLGVVSAAAWSATQYGNKKHKKKGSAHNGSEQPLFS